MPKSFHQQGGGEDYMRLCLAQGLAWNEPSRNRSHCQQQPLPVPWRGKLGEEEAGTGGQPRYAGQEEGAATLSRRYTGTEV